MSYTLVVPVEGKRPYDYGKELKKMNENPKKSFQYVVGVFAVGVLVILLVPVLFQAIF